MIRTGRIEKRACNGGERVTTSPPNGPISMQGALHYCFRNWRPVTFQITGGEHARRGMHATMRPKMSNKSKSRTRNVCRSQTLRAAEVKRSAAHASVRQSPYLQKQKQVFILSSLDELGGECGRLQSPLRKNGPAKAHIRQNMTSIFLPYSHLAYTVILT